jgi:hypothetical protein
MAALPAGAAVRQATDAVFAGSRRAHTLAPSAEWDVAGLELGLTTLLSM